MTVMERWGAEYQESNALLLKQEGFALFEQLCMRERCTFAVVGKVTNDNRIVVQDSLDGSTPVDLNLDDVLGQMPAKTFEYNRIPLELQPLRIDEVKIEY